MVVLDEDNLRTSQMFLILDHLFPEPDVRLDDGSGALHVMICLSEVILIIILNTEYTLNHD